MLGDVQLPLPRLPAQPLRPTRVSSLLRRCTPPPSPATTVGGASPAWRGRQAGDPCLARHAPPRLDLSLAGAVTPPLPPDYVMCPPGACSTPPILYEMLEGGSRTGAALPFRGTDAHVHSPGHARACSSYPGWVGRWRAMPNVADLTGGGDSKQPCSTSRSQKQLTRKRGAGTWDAPDAELVGAKTVAECQTACSSDDACDFFTFYPATASVGCAPCCFRKATDCDIIDPTRVLPAVGGPPHPKP